MDHLEVRTEEGIATVTLTRGKVHAINEAVVDELRDCFEGLESDSDIKAVIITGTGKFFSFGFDIPEFLSLSREEFARFLIKFTDFYTYLFQFPKPMIAAVNGHAIAGGCMLALTCDHRLMVSGKSKISLNEITFGASVFAGSVEMLRFCIGSANAAKMLSTGAMYTPEEALGIGLIEEIVHEETLAGQARNIAIYMASKQANAFAHIKSLLRRPIAEQMVKREQTSIRDFIEIWYSEETWAQLQEIKIY